MRTEAPSSNEITSQFSGWKRYAIRSQLGKGGMGRVYLAVDRLTGESVALKQVTLPTSGQATTINIEDSGFISDPRIALAHEFQALATLRHPNIIGVRDYGFDAEGTPYFTMDVVENGQTVIEASRERPFLEQVALFVQILYALSYIHRRGIVHRDLKPGNILVSEDTVKVLDFGLSFAADAAYGMAGTLAYMAPEVLRGESTGVPSDLYAAGVVAFEMFTCRHPFGAHEDSSNLIPRILNDPPLLNSDGLEPPIIPVLEKLLAKEKADRYEDANQVIEALATATGEPFAIETASTRESFLQAAQFVGREAEFEKMRQAIISLSTGKGSSWLVAGASGVGKSRFVDELRTQALVRAMTVLRGGTMSDGRTPYTLWQRIISRLVLTAEPEDLEASVLKAIVPDIERLLNRPVPDAPMLDPQAAQTRLYATVADLVRRQAQEHPLVIILEDLHWAGVESLELLAILTRVAEDPPILIVGNYRDDETPGLPEQFPVMQVIKLRPLTDGAMLALSESMIGESARWPQVVQLLRQETEGNPFFLVEVVRALAEEAGNLERIGRSTLPTRVFTGGLARLVDRRLDQVPEADQWPLQFTAVSGRILDLGVIQAAFPDLDLDRWLTTCANTAVLEVQDERWRFAHDKLREGLLRRLTDEERPLLHRQVAEAIEVVYPNSPFQAAALTHHWALAGDKEKECDYTVIAGLQALQSGANQEAVTFLERGLGLGHPQPESKDGRFWRACLMRAIGQAYLGLGRLAESRAYLEQMLELLGWPVPEQRWRLNLTLFWQTMAQLGHRLASRQVTGKAPATEVEELLEGARGYQQLAEIYYFANETTLTLLAGLRALNLSERAGPSPELARAYANLCVIGGLIPHDGIATGYSRRALTTAREVNDLPATAWGLLLSGTHHLGWARWQQVTELSNEGIGICEQIGDKRILGLTLGLLTLVHYHQGEYRPSDNLYDAWYNTAVEIDNVQHMTFGYMGRAENALREGQLDLAAQRAQKGITWLTEHMEDTIENRTAKIRGYGVLALVRLRQGNLEAARQAADKALALIAQIASPTRVTSLEGFAGTAEVFLSLWRQNGRDPEIQQAAEQACNSLKKYGRVFPIGRPRAQLWLGMLDRLHGRQTRARQKWQKSRHLAQQMEMPYEEGMALWLAGRYADDSDREQYLRQAETIFSRINATYELAQVRDLLNIK